MTKIRCSLATGWNKARAARVLEVDVKTLNKKIRELYGGIRVTRMGLLTQTLNIAAFG